MKKLCRSRNNKIIAGVCGGIGEYLEIDPLIIRIIFLISGVGFFLYLLIAILMTSNEDRN